MRNKLHNMDKLKKHVKDLVDVFELRSYREKYVYFPPFDFHYWAHSLIELNDIYIAKLEGDLETSLYEDSEELFDEYGLGYQMSDPDRFEQLFLDHKEKYVSEDEGINKSYYIKLNRFIAHRWQLHTRSYRCAWLEKHADNHDIPFSMVLKDVERHHRFENERINKRPLNRFFTSMFDEKQKELEEEKSQDSNYYKNILRYKRGKGFKGIYSVTGFNKLRDKLYPKTSPDIFSIILDDYLKLHKEIGTPLGDENITSNYKPNLRRLETMRRQSGGLKNLWHEYGALAATKNQYENNHPINPEAGIEAYNFASANNRSSLLITAQEQFTLMLYLFDEFSNDEGWKDKWISEKYMWIPKDPYLEIDDRIYFAECRVNEPGNVKEHPIEMTLKIISELGIYDYLFSEIVKKYTPKKTLDAAFQFFYFNGSTSIEDESYFTIEEQDELSIRLKKKA